MVEFLITSGLDIVDSNSNDLVLNSRSKFTDCNIVLNVHQIPTVNNPPVGETIEDTGKYVHEVVKADDNEKIEA